MSVINSGILDGLGTASAASREALAPEAVGADGRLPVGESVSDFHQKSDTALMTLITPCRPPQHSKWHLASGAVVLLVAYVVLLAGVRYFIGA